MKRGLWIAQVWFWTESRPTGRPVDGDPIAQRIHLHAHGTHDLTVDGDPSCTHQIFGRTTRGYPRAGQKFLKSFHPQLLGHASKLTPGAVFNNVLPKLYTAGMLSGFHPAVALWF